MVIMQHCRGGREGAYCSYVTDATPEDKAAESPFSRKLSFRELEPSSCSRLSRLLTLNFSRISRQESVLLQRRPQLRIYLTQRPCDPHPCSFCLSFDSSSRQIDRDVVAFRCIQHQQRLLHYILEDFQWEICFQWFFVDGDISFSGLNENSRDGGFSSAHSVCDFHSFSYLISLSFNSFGICASCGCCAPA